MTSSPQQPFEIQPHHHQEEYVTIELSDKELFTTRQHQTYEKKFNPNFQSHDHHHKQKELLNHHDEVDDASLKWKESFCTSSRSEWSNQQILKRFTSRKVMVRNDVSQATEEMNISNNFGSFVGFLEFGKKQLSEIRGKFSTSQHIVTNSSIPQILSDEEIMFGFSSTFALKHNLYYELLFWIFVILTLGLVFIPCKWFPWLKTWLTHSYCKRFKEADAILLCSRTNVNAMDGSHGRWNSCKIEKSRIHTNDGRKQIEIMYFKFRFGTFIYDEEGDCFVPCTFSLQETLSNEQSEDLLNGETIHSLAIHYLNHQDRNIRSKIFDRNVIETPVKPILSLAMDELFHPFYIFQIFSVGIWCWIEYYIYAIAIAVISTLSGLISLYTTRKTMVKLREMTCLSFSVHLMDQPHGQARCSRIDSSLLLPGDVIEIENGMTIPCDLVLLSGQVIVNESMMTGESTPVKKMHVPYSNKVLPKNDLSNWTLFAGTHVIMTKPTSGSHHHDDIVSYYQHHFPNKVLAMVIHTGFQTTKGRMLLPIIYPKPNNFRLYRDSFKFMGIMSIAGFVGVIFTVINLAKIHVPLLRIILENIVLITIVVPPALPIAITTTISFAIARLKESWRIFCIAPQRISFSGLIKLIVFDKTNTLTSDNLDLHGCVQVESGKFSHLLHTFDYGSFLSVGMATCHDLCNITTTEGVTKIVGDPLDMKIFESCKWRIEDRNNEFMTVISPDNKHSFSILKIFQFKSSLQRMSVIAMNLQSREIFCFSKGSSEMIKQLSKPSTIPHNFSQTLYKYSHKGYRVISIGYRKIADSQQVHIVHEFIDKLEREQVEQDLNFIGLICLENKLKADTSGVIKKLIAANLRSVIASGDNAYTVISVARKCHILPSNKKVYLSERSSDESDEASLNCNDNIIWRNVDCEQDVITSEQIMNGDETFGSNVELAVTGTIFNMIYNRHLQDLELAKQQQYDIPYVNIHTPTLLHRLMSYCRIYSRFSPSDKMKIVEEFQKLDYYVMMCGDGQNDAKALQTANVGVSLSSESEASLAAPFTSLNPSISCVMAIMREGRSALWSSFQVFKYMSLYCLIQFFSVVILFQKNTKMADFQYLYVDMFVILPTILLMTRTKSTSTLKKVRPPTSLISRFVIMSWIGQIILSFSMIGFVWNEIHQIGNSNSWLKLLDHPSEDVTKNYWSYETTIIFLTSTFCTLNCAISLSISKPFKKTLLTDNFYFVMCLTILYLFTCYFTLVPCSWLQSVLQLMKLPMYYKVRIIMYGLLHLILSYSFELLLISERFKKFVKRVNIIAVLAILRAMFSNISFVRDRIEKLITTKRSRRRKYKQLNERLGLKDPKHGATSTINNSLKTESKAYLLQEVV
ncbi:hypothetical protein C9374_007801 [Naegleria lovaniensis]|uniref:Cation-transporting ATPase n=1 Tax=Naegleria lovaniensis TaxID=51637 RepID=A0AA88GMT4_NAELO|nr:uncharacterized protein C9374_007801 [Naegleria lovaniensis]KAG2379163.1 hypothetical protein C9374_007801 [Naegleria lovaniensis]